METIKFKTNIKCEGCIAKVSSNLNQTAGKENWVVDIENPDKVLTVNKDEVLEKEIIEAVNKAGFKAERI